MPHLPRPSLLSRWMVVLTFWLMALAPAVTQAQQALNGSGTPLLSGQICSSSGNTPQPGTDQPQHLFERCPLCSLQTHQDLAPPPAAAPAPLRADLGHAVAERFLSAASTGHAWTTSHARAPPAAR